MTTELVLERVVPLSPEALWRGWTDPALLPQWFCPLPWKVVETEIDLRPGGIFRTVMQGPDGERMESMGCFLELQPPHRLVWTSALAPGYGPAVEVSGIPTFTCILTFEPVAGGTRYIARALHRDEATAQAHGAMGFQEGWGQALTQLEHTMKGHVAEG